MNAGYFPTNYFPDNYWPEDYWPDYGVPTDVKTEKVSLNCYITPVVSLECNITPIVSLNSKMEVEEI